MKVRVGVRGSGEVEVSVCVKVEDERAREGWGEPSGGGRGCIRRLGEWS